MNREVRTLPFARVKLENFETSSEHFPETFPSRIVKMRGKSVNGLQKRPIYEYFSTWLENPGKFLRHCPRLLDVLKDSEASNTV
jgi:hypothetical protein